MATGGQLCPRYGGWSEQREKKKATHQACQIVQCNLKGLRPHAGLMSHHAPSRAESDRPTLVLVFSTLPSLTFSLQDLHLCWRSVPRPSPSQSQPSQPNHSSKPEPSHKPGLSACFIATVECTDYGRNYAISDSQGLAQSPKARESPKSQALVTAFGVSHLLPALARPPTSALTSRSPLARIHTSHQRRHAQL